jgi:hypothetical protein
LHHSLTFRKILGVVICGPDGVPFDVGELALDPIDVETVFV